MTDHVHEWYLVRRAAGYVVAECSCRDELTSTQIRHRLNATERLSAEDAMTLSFTIRQLARVVGEITEKASGDTRLLEFVDGGIVEDQLQAYAAALEESQ